MCNHRQEANNTQKCPLVATPMYHPARHGEPATCICMGTPICRNPACDAEAKRNTEALFKEIDMWRRGLQSAEHRSAFNALATT